MTFLIHNLDYFIPLSLSLVFKGNTEVTKSLTDCVIVGNTLSTHLSGSERSALGQTAYITLEVSSANGYATTQMIKGDLDRLENGSQVAPTLELSPSTPIVGRNLLINPFFTVNQRGIESCGHTALGGGRYGLDGWKNASTTDYTVADDGIIMQSTNGNALITQYLEETYWGKTVTLSALIDGELHTVTGTLPSTAPSTAQALFISTVKNNLYLRLYWDLSHLSFSIISNAAVSNRKCTACKFELGGISTLIYDEPLAEFEELKRCQRYLTKLKASYNNGVYAIGAGISGGNAANYVIPLPAEMRTVTAVTYGSLKVTDKGNGGSATRTVSAMTVQSSNGNSVCLQATASGLIANGLSLLVADIAEDSYIMLTAEM